MSVTYQPKLPEPVSAGRIREPSKPDESSFMKGVGLSSPSRLNPDSTVAPHGPRRLAGHAALRAVLHQVGRLFGAESQLVLFRVDARGVRVYPDSR